MPLKLLISLGDYYQCEWKKSKTQKRQQKTNTQTIYIIFNVYSIYMSVPCLFSDTWGF